MASTQDDGCGDGNEDEDLRWRYIWRSR